MAAFARDTMESALSEMDKSQQFGPSKPADDPLLTDEAPEMTDKVALAVTQNCLDMSRSHIDAGIRRRWLDAYRAFQNQHMSGSKYETPGWRGRSRHFKPKTRAAVRGSMAAGAAALFSSVDSVKISPTNESDKLSRARAAIMHELVNYRLDRSSGVAGMQWFVESMGALQDARVTGLCISKQYWQYEERKVGTEQVEKTEQQIDLASGTVIEVGTGEFESVPIYKAVKNRPMVRTYPIDQVHRDPGAHWTEQAQEGSFVILENPMNVGDVMAMLANKTRTGVLWRDVSRADVINAARHPSGTEERSAVRRSREGATGRDRYDEGAESAIDEFATVWVHENFVRYNGQEWHYWSLGSQVLLSDPVPLEEAYPEQFGARPIVIGMGSLESHKIDPMSMVDQMAPLQREVNDLTNLTLDAVKQGVNPVTLIKRNRNINAKALDLTPAQLDEVLVEEAVAEAFADFWLTRGRQQGPVARIFERLARFIEEIRNWLTGNGYTSARQIFEDIEGGQMADRYADPTGRGFVLARRQMQERNLFPEEEGADGKPQTVIPGAERVTDKRLAERQAEAPMRSQKPQKDMDIGLFDDGKQGELFQIMRAITDTPAFKRWFGKSKVVDAEGKPLVVYHGTAAPKFEAFRPEKVGRTGYADTQVGEAYFFTTDKLTAHTVAASGIPDSELSNIRTEDVFLSLQNPVIYNPSQWGEPDVIDPEKMANAIRLARQNGRDGVIYKSAAMGDTYVVFSPTQIKSIFNAGEFAADNPNILAMVQRRQRLSRSQRLEAAIRRALASVVGRLQDYGLRARRNLQDRFIYVKRLQQEIEQGNPVTEFQNVYQAESLFHGRAADRNDKLMDEVVQPIVKKIASSNLTVEQVDEYLYARHAPERNAVIKERNPDLGDAGSGMTDAEAADVIDGFRRIGKLRAMEAIAADIDTMKEQTLRGMLRDGLISQEQYNDWRSMYQHYVPLRGWEADEDRPTGGPDRPIIGKRFDIRGREAMRAMGRTTKADSPLAYTIMQAQQAIIRGEKNKVLKTFLRLVQANPDPSLWEVNRRIAERYAKDNSKAQMLDPNAPPWVVKERWVVEKDALDVVSVKIGGQPTYIKVHDQNIAKAMKGLDAVPLHDVTKALHTVNRWLSYMSTAANPPFTISNFFRDLQTAQINLAQTEVPGIHKNVLRDIVAAGKGVWGGLNGKRDTQWQKYYHEWAAEGGKIGWMNSYDIDNHKKQLDKLLKQANGGNAEAVKAVGRLIKKNVENANMTVENAVRLSTYVNLRRAGVTKTKAASVSRELTVNFNRRGEWGTAANALYLFYNAGIQGTVRMYQAMRHPKVRRIVYGIMASSIALDLYNRMFAGDDDDDENHYDKIPFWVKERNLIVMYPDGSGRRLQIPLPWGYNLFHVAGQQASATLFGPEKPMQAAINVGTTAINAFNPLGGADNPTRVLTPTFLDPFVDLYSNRDWLGRQIAPDYGPSDKRPDSQRYWNSVTGPSKETARFLNEVTGGNEVRPGAIDVSPETIDYWFETVFGGAGATAKRTYGMLEKVWSGEAVETFEIPFLRRLYGTPSPTLDSQLYYELRDNVDLTKREFELARETGDKQLEEEVRARPEFKMIELVKDAENKRRQIRKSIRKIEASKLSDEEKAKRRDMLIERMDQVQTLVRKRYNSLTKQAD